MVDVVGARTVRLAGRRTPGCRPCAYSASGVNPPDLLHDVIMPSAKRSPAEPVLRLAGLLEDSISEYMHSLGTVDNAGHWEAPIEGWAFGTVMCVTSMA
jgi:hypothetical protein